MEYMEFSIIPEYVDEIIVYGFTKKEREAIKKAGLEYVDGECYLTMLFEDGIAYEINGTGLVMRYPTMAELEKSPSKQKAICDYTGIYDGTINQYDVALRYGKLEFSKKERDKLIHWTKRELGEHDDTLALLAADLLNDIYNMTDDFMDYHRAARIVSILAAEFEKELDWQENDERDFFQELYKFEEKAMETLKDEININNKWE